MKKNIKDYSYLTVEQIQERIEANDKILQQIWNEDDGNSWENYKKKCRPYWDDNEALDTALSLKSEPEMRPFDSIDKRCRMPIKTFKACCEDGAIINSDGFGYYANEKEVSNIEAIPSAFAAGMIRTDFKYVCWYNK